MGARRACVAAWAAALAVFGAGPLAAGEWHYGNGLACTDCHTMHNSSGGAPMRYDNEAQPAPKLLRHATTLSLCLYCHDGAVTSAPDVVAPVSYVADPAGGLFPENWSAATGKAHVLGGADPVTPPGGTQAMVLTCVSCHDPHGNPNFRNLRPDPGGTGQPPATVTVKQQVVANGTNPAQVYVAANLLDKGGMSAFCGSCHQAFHGRSVDAEGVATPWLRHPQEQALSTSQHADYGYWLGTVPDRVRVETPSDDVVPSEDDRVFCLSCHKAHGSDNRASLIFADGASLVSTCSQCHNK